LPPASFTFLALASAFSVQMYVFHIARGGAPSGTPEIAATSPPLIRPTKYWPPDSGGMTFSNSQPKRPL
jgi:hypothetical protein